MQNELPLDHAAAISMLQRLDTAGRIGEMPLQEALDFANALTDGHGQDLLNNLSRRNLITPIGRGAIRLVKLTTIGRKTLASGDIPAPPPITSAARQSDDTHSPGGATADLSSIGRPPRADPTHSRLVDDRADQLASRIRERAGFIASIAGGILTLAGVLEAIGVPEAQSNATQSHESLNLWKDAWFVAGIAVGAFGLILLLTAAALYFSRRRARLTGVG